MSNAQLSGNTAPVNSWQHSLLSIHMPFSSSPAFGQDVGKNKKFHYFAMDVIYQLIDSKGNVLCNNVLNSKSVDLCLALCLAISSVFYLSFLFRYSFDHPRQQPWNDSAIMIPNVPLRPIFPIPIWFSNYLQDKRQRIKVC